MIRRYVATFRASAYLGPMPVTRFMRILTILAVLLAPLGMIAGTSAQAATTHSASAATHRAEMPGWSIAPACRRATIARGGNRPSSTTA